ncbi:MAG: hypothetical protein OXF85_00515 [Candidatus Saccharibacteria bacterium]|nr:hypothetical protein [Candidatus Saccharibacteria bacterium]MCY4010463.1 hypothetical protein [Candidatus Saccharibacteria bacterium]
MPFSLENVAIACLYLGVIGLIVISVQVLFHWRLIVGEYSRKLTHILIAFWMATWRFNLTQLEVTYLGLFLILAILVAQQLKIFNSIFGINRVTYGEVSYVIGIILTSLLFPDPTVYALAVINLGLADGFAAIIGTKYGRIKYNVFGSTKSLAGMFTSFVIVIISGLLFWILAVDYKPSLVFVCMHIISTAAVVSGLEFVSFKGLDNLTIPLATGLLYSSLIV